MQRRLMREGALRPSSLRPQRAPAPWRKQPRQPGEDLGAPVAFGGPSGGRRTRCAPASAAVTAALQGVPRLRRAGEKPPFRDAENRKNKTSRFIHRGGFSI
ncbi:hypothetical protein OH491_10485 [Termitidicoccus mucosus]|uniref:hypothetical protein n=1 Tax=Termitidicoccus mucosus TaxID=1184151 RepID=UPI0011AB7CCE